MPKISSPGDDGKGGRQAPDATPLSPLDLILSVMRDRYRAGDIDGAITLARLAAPYLHPRAVTAGGSADLADMPDADLDKLHRPD